MSLLLLLACGPGLNLSGDWSGAMICDETEYRLDWGPVEKVGGLWQGAGVLDYGDSALGERMLEFELEVEVTRDGLDAQLYDCELVYASAPEPAPCLPITLEADEEDPNFLTGTLDICPVELSR